jgi:hypothetical protein
MNRFNPSLSIFAVVISILGLGLSAPNHADGRGRRLPPIKEATITSVNSNSITVSVQKGAGPRRGSVIGGDGQTTATKTYKITSLTTVEINGQVSDVNSLQVGMSVSISADPPDDMDATNASDGGTATSIIAHDAPLK